MKDSAKEIKFTESHEWILPDDDTGELIIGITQHAQEQLGEIVFIDLPKVSAQFSEGDTLGVIESVKAASDIYAPVSGRITQVNKDLEDNPALVNNSPYEDGWLFRLDGDINTAKNLLTKEEYQKLIGS